MAEMARTAMARLARRQELADLPAELVVVPGELVVRGTTAPPRP